MTPQHLSGMQATTTSDPNILANHVGKYGANMKLESRKKKKSQQSKETQGECGWRAPRKHKLDVDI